MHRIRPRFTLRWLMVAVAVLAIVLAWNGWMKRRSAGFRFESSMHLQAWMTLADPRSPTAKGPRTAYHKAMAAKYRWAARYPWLPVTPDPPEPE